MSGGGARGGVHPLHRTRPPFTCTRHPELNPQIVAPVVKACDLSPVSILRLAIAQFRPRKGDVSANLSRAGRVLAQAAAMEPHPHVIQFPETILSGYFVEGGVRENALSADDVVLALDAHWRARSQD